ncbi:MAG: hypothetical protein ACRCUM_02600 [Mycoplasmoidaceae bacterium]
MNKNKKDLLENVDDIVKKNKHEGSISIYEKAKDINFNKIINELINNSIKENSEWEKEFKEFQKSQKRKRE